jgi:hypothetical protein
MSVMVSRVIDPGASSFAKAPILARVRRRCRPRVAEFAFYKFWAYLTAARVVLGRLL